MSDRLREVTIAVAAALSLCVWIPHASGQVGPLPSWEVLADESKLVVVAQVVEARLSVVDPRRRAKVETGPDGKFSFGNPALFTVGILARVQVLETIKGDGKVKQGDLIPVFIYGYYGNDLPHVPMDREVSVLFLRPVDPNDKRFVDTAIQMVDRAAPLGRRTKYDRFEPRGCYTPVEGGYAQVLVPPDKPDIVGKIKKAIAAR
jgi:hypothetical protein